MMGDKREIRFQAGGQGEQQCSRKKNGFVDYDSELPGHLSE